MKSLKSRKQARFASFDADTPMGKFTAIVKWEDGMSERDARTDAFSLMISAFGKAVKVGDKARFLAKLPEGVWEEEKCKGWGWVAKGILPAR